MNKMNSNKQNIKIKKSEHINIGNMSINNNYKDLKSEKKYLSAKSIKKAVIQLVSQGEIRKGITLLSEHLDENDIKYNQAILLLSRINAVELEEGSGVSSYNSIRKEYSGIRKSIISLAQRLD